MKVKALKGRGGSPQGRTIDRPCRHGVKVRVMRNMIAEATSKSQPARARKDDRDDRDDQDDEDEYDDDEDDSDSEETESEKGA